MVYSHVVVVGMQEHPRWNHAGGIYGDGEMESTPCMSIGSWVVASVGAWSFFFSSKKDLGLKRNTEQYNRLQEK